MRSVYAPHTEIPTPDAPLAPVPAEILDQFVRQGPISHEELEAAVRRFKKAIIERALGGELTHHLGYPPGGTKPEDTTNHRNGTGSKTVLTDDGPLAIEVPRDREGSFEPRSFRSTSAASPASTTRFWRSTRAGMTVREIQGFLAEMYAVEVSPDLISTVTDGIVAEVTAWQSRPLERMYPVVFFDALRVKIRDEATVRSKAIYLALAVLPDGTRDILGTVDRADRRRQILDEGLQRSENARVPGHPDRGHRRAQRHERGARRRVSRRRRCKPASCT